MVFHIPDNLAPECYPLAWLMDSWRGAGVLEYEGIEAAAYLHELTIDNEYGGPHLRVRSDIWLANEPAGIVDQEVPGGAMYAELTKGEIWSSLTGYVRATPGADKRDGATLLEAMTSSPAGHAITWAGLIKGPQIQLAADAIAATPTAGDITAARVVGGLVHSDLFVAYDMAAFGAELRSYIAGRLSRVHE